MAMTRDEQLHHGEHMDAEHLRMLKIRAYGLVDIMFSQVFSNPILPDQGKAFHHFLSLICCFRDF